jgi:hypothetical protein
MTTSSSIPTVAATGSDRLRLRLFDEALSGRADGVWWPRSRDLQREAADLVDHFPRESGRIGRLLFSRPDWDDPTRDGRGVRRIRAARGEVKVGSFPSDDTHLMILTMGSGRRLKLVVVPSDTPTAEGEELLRSAEHIHSATDEATGLARWDDESPN